MNPMGPEFGGHIFSIIGVLVWGVCLLVAAVIALAVVVLLVRFLWFGTKAAKLYIASHEPVSAAPSDELPTIPDATAAKPRKPKN